MEQEVLLAKWWKLSTLIRHAPILVERYKDTWVCVEEAKLEVWQKDVDFISHMTMTIPKVLQNGYIGEEPLFNKSNFPFTLRKGESLTMLFIPGHVVWRVTVN